MNPQKYSQGGDVPNSQGPMNTQSAAANVIRSQIDALYNGQSVPPTHTNTGQSAPQQPVAQTPYQRVHAAHPQPQSEQWKAYHSAWQNYYQEYYKAYYSHQQTLRSQQANTTDTTPQSSANATSEYFAHSQQNTNDEIAVEVSKDQALYELRKKLLGSVQARATKIRKSRHFMPIAAALVVVLIFLFLQYNRVIIATVNAYVSPGAINPQNLVVEPTKDIAVTPDPRLVIPKINVDVPVIYNVGYDHASQMAAMEKGVAHFAIPGANSHPGEIGNTVLSGHSSNDLFDQGDYKFIFAQLEKLTTGDTIYAHYEGKRYTYIVTKKEVVKPHEVNRLIYPADKPILTLITCTPLGTALNRLLVTAEQISPDPSSAAAAPQGSGQATPESTSIPGDSPTLLERLFGAR